MNAPLIQDIAYHLLSKAANERIVVGTTKLIKLLYLIDCEYYKWHRSTATGANWVFFHYGPYSEELVQVAERAPGVQPEQIREFAEGRFYRGYRITERRSGVGRDWSAPLRGVVDSTFAKWAAVDLPLLLDYVYYETQPMVHAVRFEPIDFSLIPDPRDTAEVPRDFAAAIPEDKRELLRRKLKSRPGGYAKTKPLRVEVDESHADALLAMDDE